MTVGHAVQSQAPRIRIRIVLPTGAVLFRDDQDSVEVDGRNSVGYGRDEQLLTCLLLPGSDEGARQRCAPAARSTGARYARGFIGQLLRSQRRRRRGASGARFNRSGLLGPAGRSYTGAGSAHSNAAASGTA